MYSKVGSVCILGWCCRQLKEVLPVALFGAGTQNKVPVGTRVLAQHSCYIRARPETFEYKLLLQNCRTTTSVWQAELERCEASISFASLAEALFVIPACELLSLLLPVVVRGPCYRRSCPLPLPLPLIVVLVLVLLLLLFLFLLAGIRVLVPVLLLLLILVLVVVVDVVVVTAAAAERQCH